MKTADSCKVDLAHLPSTEDATTFYTYLTYHQVQFLLEVEKYATHGDGRSGLIPTTIAANWQPLSYEIPIMRVQESL